jgi:UDPglucose 6-dehydrogenase
LNKIAMFGCGYVGLVTGVCLAHLGHEITCIDIDDEKVENLKRGISPIFEQDLPEMLAAVLANGNIDFTADAKTAVTRSEIVFIAVGTPTGTGGEADLGAVMEVAATIGRYLNSHKIIVTKSTVPPGTGDMIAETISANCAGHETFDVLSNPEFLREGVAVKDFLYPDRVVIGGESQAALEKIKHLYEQLNVPIHCTDRRSSELIKYASNCFLAIKISFINELSRVAECLNADIEEVAAGMGLDNRIGPHFLKAGAGYGGSCFPKDTRALAVQARELGRPFTLVETAIAANETQHLFIVEKIRRALGVEEDGNLQGVTIGLLGLAFKPGTDDIREAPALFIARKLVDLGAAVSAYDPQAMPNTQPLLPRVAMADSAMSAIRDIDLLVILTEWPEFTKLSPTELLQTMRGRVIVDSRNCLPADTFRNHGFTVIGVGKGKAGNCS